MELFVLCAHFCHRRIDAVFSSLPFEIDPALDLGFWFGLRCSDLYWDAPGDAGNQSLSPGNGFHLDLRLSHRRAGNGDGAVVHHQGLQSISSRSEMKGQHRDGQQSDCGTHTC